MERESSHQVHACWAAAADGTLPVESDGPPPTWDRVLDRALDHQVGVWEVGPGTLNDVEVDELFVVLSGRGHIQVHDGPRFELVAGTVCFLAQGSRTTWHLHETLRKVYVRFGAAR